MCLFFLFSPFLVFKFSHTSSRRSALYSTSTAALFSPRNICINLRSSLLKVQFQVWFSSTWQVLKCLQLVELDSVIMCIKFFLNYLHTSDNPGIILVSQQFSQNNSPTLFQIRFVISMHQQGESSLNSYGTKLKSYQDELLSLNPFLECSWVAVKILIECQQKEYVINYITNKSYYLSVVTVF